MITLSRDHFVSTCKEFIGSEERLSEVVRQNKNDDYRIIFCETKVLEALEKKYPKKEELFKYISKHINDKCFHICEYSKSTKFLKIDSSIYEDVIME